jgi:hypothetical protein
VSQAGLSLTAVHFRDGSVEITVIVPLPPEPGTLASPGLMLKSPPCCWDGQGGGRTDGRSNGNGPGPAIDGIVAIHLILNVAVAGAGSGAGDA